MQDNLKCSPPSNEPKRNIHAEGFKYMFQSTKESIDKQPLHSPYKITPLEYHGYKETAENVRHVLEELKYELSVYPEHTDILLDKIIQMGTLLKKIEDGK